MSRSSRCLLLLAVLALATPACGSDTGSTTTVPVATTVAATTTVPVATTVAATTTVSVATTVAATTTVSVATTVAATTTTDPLVAFEIDSIDPGQLKPYTFVSESAVEIDYLLYLPVGYPSDRTWPLILSVHGFIDASQTVESVRAQNPLTWLDPSVEFPFVVVAPKGPAGPWSDYHGPMDELLDVLSETLSLDDGAMFVTGFSAGGGSALEWAIARPDLFTGAASTASGLPSGSLNTQAPDGICRLADVPVWVAHSETDEIVPFDKSVEIVEALEVCGNVAVEFVVYERGGHFQSAERAYEGPDLYDWMLQQAD